MDITKEWISEPEDISLEVPEWMKRGKIIRKKEHNIQNSDMIAKGMNGMGTLKEEWEKGAEKIFVVITEKFPRSVTDTKQHIQEA